MPPDDEALAKKRNELKARINEIGDLRPGSLVERFRRCGKPTCRCAKPDAIGHGPSWSLTHAVEGKTMTKVIPSAAVEQTKKQIAEYKRFRELAQEFIDTSERLCDVRLREPEAASDEVAKKGASRSPSRKKSPPKSKRS